LKQIKNLAQSLETRFGALDRTEFQRRVRQGQRIANQIEHLYDLRARNEIAASNAEFYRVLRSGEYLFADDYQALLTAAARQTGRHPGGGPGIILSGVLPNPPGILSLLDRHGIRILEDDLLNCSRRLRYAPAQSDDPFETLTEQYFNLPPCSTRNSSIQDRLTELWAKIDHTGARGVIFYVVKFCEPELFDIPLLTTALKKRGVKTLVIDVELSRHLSGQLETRLEAFIEMLTD
jgi:benzoyl-CoA reductase/2-hydroxyglutaryl-CoA dehydratase subunit BcrC/BadD/HgdB